MIRIARSVVIGGHVFERVALAPDVDKVGFGYPQFREVAFPVLRPDVNQSSGVFERKRPQNERVDDAELNGCCADSHCQCQDGDRCKNRVLSKDASGVTKILKNTDQRLPPENLAGPG